MTTLTYAYLAENVPFTQLSKKDFTRLGNSFKKFYEANHQYTPFYTLPIPNEGYDSIAHHHFDSKESLFQALDKVCYLKNGSDSEKIATRKILIGIYQNLDEWLEPDEEFGSSFYIDTRDPLWAGIQDMDGFYIHRQGEVWFINKSDAEDIARDQEEDDSEFWDYAAHRRASLDSDEDLKQYFLERNNI